MADHIQQTTKPARTFDRAYSFSFSVALGLILFIAGLVIVLTLSDGTSLGLIFGIPLLVSGLILPLIMMRDVLKSSEVSGVCPYCSAAINTTDATIRLNCPACSRKILVRDQKLEPGE